MKNLNSVSVRICLLLAIPLCMFVALPGCSTTPASASFASVVITNRSAHEIQSTAAQVFRENGFAGGATGPTSVMFQKEGTAANSLAYNGIAGAYYGATTLVRVKGDIVDLGGGSLRLQCQTYMVRNAGDSFFEEETRLTNMRSGPYQKMLNEVGKRLP